ncbi:MULTISPECIES: hypothetical protein [unclassified Psychrobacillus]|uniref:hypothetical protein n=1 Tax=unclassified Psychrobacillus TaxID=2636677 RepID=UPI0030F5D7E6
MRFYHISTELLHTGLFQPAIPKNRHKDAENDKIPRICVSNSVEGCLSAIPNGGSRLDEMNYSRRGYYLLFTIDTEKLGISSENIMTNEQIYELDYVRDADFTGEHWILQEFQVDASDIQLICLHDWAEEPVDVLPFSIFAIAEEKYEGDYLTAYMEMYDDLVPCSVRISEANYHSSVIESGQIISLQTDSMEEAEEVAILLAACQNVEVIKVDTYDVAFQTTGEAHLGIVFEQHFELASQFN